MTKKPRIRLSLAQLILLIATTVIVVVALMSRSKPSLPPFENASLTVIVLVWAATVATILLRARNNAALLVLKSIQILAGLFVLAAVAAERVLDPWLLYLPVALGGGYLLLRIIWKPGAEAPR